MACLASHAGISASLFDFAKLSRLHVVNEPAHGNMLRYPGMRFHLLYLLANVFFQIVERIEVSGFAGDRACLLRQSLPQFVLLDPQQAAVSVVDDDELLRVEQVMRHDQGADRVIRGNAAGIADHMCITWAQTETMLEQDSRVHAGEDGGMATRPN